MCFASVAVRAFINTYSVIKQWRQQTVENRALTV